MYKIRNIVNADNIKEVIVNFMREVTKVYPMPASDINDIEAGIIQIRK